MKTFHEIKEQKCQPARGTRRKSHGIIRVYQRELNYMGSSEWVEATVISHNVYKYIYLESSLRLTMLRNVLESRPEKQNPPHKNYIWLPPKAVPFQVRPVTSWKGRVEISCPAAATPMMTLVPHPLWQASRAALCHQETILEHQNHNHLCRILTAPGHKLIMLFFLRPDVSRCT